MEYQSASEFEWRVINLLREITKTSGKPLLPGYRKKINSRNIEFDAIAPEGLLSFEGNVLIEIKNYPNKNFNKMLKFQEQIDRISSYAEQLPPNTTILFILISKPSPTFTNKVHDTSYANNLKIIIWDINDLVIERNLIVHSEVHSTKKNRSNQQTENSENNSYKKELNEAFRRGKLTILIGTGASVAYQVPMWHELICRLLKMLLKQEGIVLNKVSIKNLLRNEFQESSSIVLGRILRTGFGQLSFVNSLRDALYSEFISKPKGETIYTAIGDLVNKGMANPPKIINFNFDNILCEHLTSIGIPNTPIFSTESRNEESSLPIYHVHGHLPRTGSITNEMLNSIVFGEQEYHGQYSDPHSWQSILQLSEFKDQTALFVGLSMADPNIRRLLEIARKYSAVPKHYVILKNKWTNLSNKAHIFLKKKEEALFSDLGVNVVWVDDYPEIPKFIKTI
jgi:hypothetical protein